MAQKEWRERDRSCAGRERDRKRGGKWRENFLTLPRFFKR